jgi:hypothetical protein
MGTIDNERVRKEAADAVTSRPPASTGSQVDEAIRRYLGGEMYHALEHETPTTTPTKRADKGSPASREKGRRP